MKYLTCLQFLDKTKGQKLFCSAVLSPDVIRQTASFVIGEDIVDDFIHKRVPDSKRQDAKISISALMFRAQGRVHKNIRKKMVCIETTVPPGYI